MKLAPSPKPRKLANLTWEHPKGSGIKIAEMPNITGGRVFGVSYQVRIPAKLMGRVGKREMTQWKTKVEAERLAEDRFIALKKHGTEFSKMPADAQRQAAIAWSKLEPHGIDFIEAVETAIKFLRPAGGDRTVSATVAELLASKQARQKAGRLTQRTHDDFKTRGERFAEDFKGRLIKEITHTEIAKWLSSLTSTGHGSKGKPLGHRSVLNYRNTLAELFRHAQAKQYCAVNPLDRFTPEDYKALGGLGAERGGAVNILTVSEARKLLETAVEEMGGAMLGSVVLRLFCGIRTEEISKVDWSEVRWLEAKPYVHIPEGKAKMRRVRQIELPPNALAWLKLLNPPASGLVVPSSSSAKTYSNLFGKLAKLAGFGERGKDGKWHTAWVKNGTRHSFGSYHYALYDDALRTAKEMGHRQNDEVFFANYRSLVTREQAEDYFNLRPTEEASKIALFPAASA